MRAGGGASSVMYLVTWAVLSRAAGVCSVKALPHVGISSSVRVILLEVLCVFITELGNSLCVLALVSYVCWGWPWSALCAVFLVDCLAYSFP